MKSNYLKRLLEQIIVHPEVKKMSSCSVRVINPKVSVCEPAAINKLNITEHC